jgi:rare lipoprotein A (peptidoglycan hydrolase)
MPHSIALRVVGLAAVTLIAGVTAWAFIHNGGDGSKKKGALPRAAGSWYTALAAPYVETAKPKRGACGVLIGPRTMGVANPVLPCGVKIYIEFGGKQVLTQVIDRGPDVPGREFDVTRALAQTIGLSGTRTINWRFAK